MATEENIKMAVIVGANAALEYKEESPYLTKEEIMKRVTANIKQIIEKIDFEEEDDFG